MTATEERTGWQRFLDIALAASLACALLIAWTGGLVFEFLGREVSVRRARTALLIFAVLWLVRLIGSRKLGRAGRTALVAGGWSVLGLVVLVAVNWAGSAFLSLGETEPEWPSMVPEKATELSGSSSWNVLLISLDTLRSDHLSCYGYRRRTSPSIDRLASEGVLFRNQIASAPSTLASHASLLTSLNPSAHGAHMYPPRPLSDDAVTLAEILRDEGFRTAAITSGGQLDRAFNLTQGFDLYTDTDEPFRESIGEATSWIADHQDDRWFLFLHTYQTHLPYRPHAGPSERFSRGYEGSLPKVISLQTVDRINQGRLKIDAADLDYIVARYDGEIAYTDLQLGHLFQSLREMGVWEKTLVIVTSDHGEEFGEHGWVAWHSHTLFDELLKVPFVMKVPERFEGRVVDQQTRGIDLAPTILGMLGMPKPESMQGVSLQPLLDSRVSGPGPPALSERESETPLISWRTDNAKLMYPRDALTGEKWLASFSLMSAAEYAKIRPHRALFDLRLDPGESNDTYRRQAGLGRTLLDDLAQTHDRDVLLAPPEKEAEVGSNLRDRLRALGYVD